jgi:hypothetical protein
VTDRADDLVDLASSIGDGNAVDWTVFDAAANADADPEVLRELGVIARIAAAHAAASREPVESVPREDDSTWGPLIVKERLGAGSFGTVYRAHDPNLDRDVALKLYRATPANSGSLQALFAEGRLLARLHHPNVVVVHGIEQHGEEVGLWLELINGRTLADEVRSSGPLGFREAALVGLDVCRALAAVHRAGLVHRDVKAQNVMRERGGRIVLMDFGISRGPDGASPAPEPGGTPLYMAPELFAGGRASVATDVYSVGVLLFFLLTGEFPVSAPGRVELAHAHGEGRRHLLRDARPDVPDVFADVVDRACAADPRDRFATAGAMQAALAAAVGVASEGTGGQAVRAAAGVRKAWPGWLGKVAAVLLLGIAAGGALWFRGLPAPGDKVVRKSEGPPLPGDSYQVQVGFQRMLASGPQRLVAGDRVAPGDRLFAEVHASRAVHLYIVNQDEHGESYLLFPLPGQATTNPLPPDAVHRVPGTGGGEPVYWQVTSAGGREHFLVVVSPEPLAALDAVLATLPKPEIGRPVLTAAPIASQTLDQLRGVGGLTTKRPEAQPGSDLLRSAVALTPGVESATGPWMRQFTLDNPGK